MTRAPYALPVIPPPLVAFDLAADLLEREATAQAGDALAPLLGDAGGPDSALFIVSANAGRASALRFWADAQRSGVGLANPELFPWCLANSPGAALSRRFGLAGPNATWLDGDAALPAAWQAAHDLLRDGRAARVFVVALQLGEGDAPGRVRAWLATAPPGQSLRRREP